jgi:hypothetical protein
MGVSAFLPFLGTEKGEMNGSANINLMGALRKSPVLDLGVKFLSMNPIVAR